MLISVLMPVLNPHPVYFPKAVASILGQTYSDLELVIVEDPSPASAADLLTAFSDRRIRHLRNPERTSLTRQLNQGLAAANGEWVARMDADDIALPQRLEKQRQFLQENPEIDVLGSRLNIIGADDLVIAARRYPETHEEILRTMPIYNPIAHPAVIFRKQSVVEAGGYEPSMHSEDCDLWSRLAKKGKRFANHSEALLHYRLHSGSVKSRWVRDSIRGTLNVKRKYWAGDMGVRGNFRMLCERCLLWLPPSWVLAMFQWRYLQKKK